MPLEPGKLATGIRKCLARRAGRGLPEFLRKVKHAAGGGALLPVETDEEVLRFLGRLGYVGNRASRTAAKKVSELIEREARAGGLDRVEVSVLLRMFASGVYGVVPEGVCGADPDCPSCPFLQDCPATAKRRAKPAPGESPAERLRELGPRSLSTRELVAAVLDEKAASDVAPLLEGGLRALARMTARELSLRPGVGKKKAARLLAAMELGRRWAEEPKERTRRFRSGQDFYDEYRFRLRDEKKEQFICILLDQKNHLIRDEVISMGGLISSQVHPREVFRSAIREAAAAVAFVHNHPSGDPKPSEDDKLVTTRLAGVAKLVGLRLLDHVIIGEGEFYSFFEDGLL